MPKLKKKEFKSTHSSRTVRCETVGGVKYIRCKYTGFSKELGADYFSYNAELYKILRSTKVGFIGDIRCKRAEFRTWSDEDKKQIKIYASHLAYGCYHGFIKYETLASDIKRFRAYIGGNNLVVDHLNDNSHINTEYNLSLMSSDDNHRKSDIISRIKEPAACVVSYVGGAYRVRLFLRTNTEYFLREYDASPERRAALLSKIVEGGHPNWGWFEEHYICYSANELLACLRRDVIRDREHTLPLREKRKGSILWVSSPSGEYWGSDIKYIIFIK